MLGQDHFADIVRSSEDAILSKDLNGIVTSWNPAAERLFGYSADEIIGTPIIRLFPADLVHQEDMILARIRAEEPVGMIHTRRLHKDGHVLDVALTISPLRDASGKVIGASKIVRDARPWLESERRRLESETNFEMVANSIPQLCWICDPSGNILWYNRRWTEFTGFTLDQLQGDDSVHHPDYKDQARAKFREHLASGEEWEDTFPLRGKDGQYRWFLSRAEPIRDEAGNIARWFGTDTDITDMREASERIRLLMLEVNHRSKNMLGVVMALGRNTLRLSGADFLERFNQRLLSLAANQDVLVKRDWTEVPVAELVEAQLRFVQGSPGTMETGGPDVSLTPKAAEVIGMALHELATNAIKHGALSQEGGRVSLVWQTGPREGGQGTDGLLLRWQESGGPPVAAPSRTGFGTTLIRDIPARSLGPTVLDYRPEGLFWELSCGPDALPGAARLPDSGA
jgi:PAS domain S-box-containing protein